MDWVAAVERCYDVDLLSSESWLEELARAASPLFSEFCHVGLITGRYADRALVIDRLVSSGGADCCEWVRKINEWPEVGNLIGRGGAVQSLSKNLFPVAPRRSDEIVRMSAGQLRDVVGLAAHTGGGHVLALAGFSERIATVTAVERQMWPLAVAHLAAAFRFRQKLQHRKVRLLDAAQAVLATDGQTVHAEGAAATKAARQALRAAVVRIDVARTRAGRLDGVSAVKAWECLVAGRWSIVDYFDTDGRRYVLALDVSSEERSDPRGLTAHQRRCADLVGLGYATKEIALTLGVTEAAVTSTITRVRWKLGLRSRAEVGAFFSPSGVRARLGSLTLEGERWLLGSYSTLSKRLLARLTAAERAISALLLAGCTNEDVARVRRTSVRTVANQVHSVYRKLGVRSRVELATRLQNDGPS